MSDWSKSLRDTNSTPRSKLLNGKSKSLSTTLGDGPTLHPTISSGSHDLSDTPDSSSRRTPTLRSQRSYRDGSETPPSRGPKNAKRNLAFTPPARIREEPMFSSPPGSPRAMSDDTSIAAESDSEYDADCVQVLVRVRPVNEAEVTDGQHQPCLTIMGTRNLIVQAKGKEPHLFKFDQVLPETTEQDEIFDIAGLPIVENCINGYNSSIFAYGQTGSGKTYTMLGSFGSPTDPQRGIMPRVFEFLFHRIAEQEDKQGRESLRYCCRCSFLEIYNEAITDLLNPTPVNLQIREGDKRGPYVDGLTEEIVLNVDEVLALLKRGADARHVGATMMNRESSRSHSVFTCTVERSTKSSSGLTQVLFSRLNLIDLAGSERQKQSGVQGGHLREACHINKSLTILGRVIMELVEAQRSGKHRHVPYRDSRLTFLLQDSLGGNAKTMIIANVSPSMVNSQETLSTLHFAKRAKYIRNKPTQNKETTGQVSALQKEIVRLHAELDSVRKGNHNSLIAEMETLRKQLQTEELDRQEVQLQLDQVTTDSNRYKRERDRIETKLQKIQSDRRMLNAAIQDMSEDLERYQVNTTLEAKQNSLLIKALESNLSTVTETLLLEQAAFQEKDTALNAKAAKLQQQLSNEQTARQTAQDALEVAQKESADLFEDLKNERANSMAFQKQSQDLMAKQQQQREEYNSLSSNYRTLQQQSIELDNKLQAESARSQQLTTDLDALQSKLVAEETHRQDLEAKLEESILAKEAAGDEAAEKLENLEQLMACAKKQHAAEVAGLAAAEEALKAELQRVIAQKEEVEKQLQEQAEHGQRAIADLETRLSSSNNEGSSLQEQLLSMREDKLQLEKELQGQLEAARKHNEELQTKVDEQLQNAAEMRSKIELGGNEITKLQHKLEQECKAADDLRAEVSSLSAQLDNVRQDLDMAVAKLKDEGDLREAKDGECSMLLNQVEVLKAQLERSSEKEQNLTRNLASTEEQQDLTKSALWEAEEKIEAMEKVHQETVLELEMKKAELSNMLGQLHKTEGELELERKERKSVQESYFAEIATSEEHQQAMLETQQKLEAEVQTRQKVEEELEGEKTVLQDLKLQLEAERVSKKEVEETLVTEQTTLQDVQRQLREECLQKTEVVQALQSEKEQHAEVASKLVVEQKSREDLQQAHDLLANLLEQEKDVVSQLKTSLSETAEQLAAVQGELQSKRVKHSQIQGELQSQVEGLQQGLNAALAEVDKRAEAEAQLEQQLEQVKAAMTNGEEEHATQLEQLTAQLTEARAAVEQHVNIVEQRSRALDETDGNLRQLEKEKMSLEARLSAAEAQVTTQESQLGDLAEKLAALKLSLGQEQTACNEAKAACSAREGELADLRRESEHAKTQSSSQQQEQLQRIHGLQKEVIKLQEKLVGFEFDNKKQVSQLTAELEGTQQELQKTNEQLQAKNIEIKDVREELAEVRSVQAELAASHSQKDREASEVQKALAEALATAEKEQRKLADKLLATNQEVIMFKEKLVDNETQFKDELIRSARHGRAFQEIRRLIDWAVTPSTPTRTSLASPTLNKVGIATRSSVERLRMSSDYLDSKAARTPGGSIIDLMSTHDNQAFENSVPLLELPQNIMDTPTKTLFSPTSDQNRPRHHTGTVNSPV